ncbi:MULTISPECIES: TRAP transporter small permease [Halomonadaceae]|jgi:TRAP-type C4-dicarboxylate transport system permease small subunit|uniref:TRAP transporter small permease protein n=1 Tax=Billgrantia aerodenitrificans TaxID=2733483 RepID=A0ABS9AXQ4_9GAMM|nr:MULTISPECIES: TRAP transporter small permease [Halomonas]MCE8026535.1 TRAP transporter small permease [Halomonas aerodenitrificans]MCE8038571.1 TRAP transporter small permease [Halomonas sp. MCCC 1A11062]
MTSPNPLPDEASAYLADPRREPLELDIEGGRGPAPFRWLTRLMEHLIATILVALIVSVSANVIGRSLLNRSLPWADELARMLFIWLIFIGAAAAFARYEHIAVDFLVRRLQPRAAYALYLLQHLIIATLMSIMVWGGYLVMSRSTGRTAILGVPWNLINVSLVLCSLFIVAVALWRAWQCLRLIRDPNLDQPQAGD